MGGAGSTSRKGYASVHAASDWCGDTIPRHHGELVVQFKKEKRRENWSSSIPWALAHANEKASNKIETCGPAND
jgi:hypothetical protein